MKSKLLFSGLMLAFLGFASVTKAQDGSFDRNHPRRAEVNGRLANQNARIDNKVKDGDLSKAQAATLHHEDHAIRKEEQRDAAKHDGHITKHEQNKLNRQENHVSHRIRKA